MDEYLESDEVLDALGEIDEALLESDEMDEMDERVRRRRRFRPPVPSGKGLYKPRPTGNYVTQVQLRTALARVGGQIKTQADATKAVGTRLGTLTDRVDREAAARKKDTAAVRQDVRRSSEMGILPMLLARPPKIETKTEKVTVSVPPATAGGTPTSKEIDVVTNVSVASTDNTNLLLVVMMMAGMGQSFGGTQQGDSMQTMLPLVLLLGQR
jgi:hypothetical protein